MCLPHSFRDARPDLSTACFKSCSSASQCLPGVRLWSSAVPRSTIHFFFAIKNLPSRCWAPFGTTRPMLSTTYPRPRPLFPRECSCRRPAPRSPRSAAPEPAPPPRPDPHQLLKVRRVRAIGHLNFLCRWPATTRAPGYETLAASAIPARRPRSSRQPR